MGTGVHTGVDELVAMGTRVRDARSRRGFTVAEFAALAGITADELTALEHGEPQVSLAALTLVAEALELTVANLFDANTPALRSEPYPYVTATAAPDAPHSARATPVYVPLEMPEMWEPTPTPPRAPARLPMNPPTRQHRPAPAPSPVPQAARAIPPQAGPPVAVPQPVKFPEHRMSQQAVPMPRTFADLRVGPLAQREFQTLPQFAVAAVVELGHPTWVIAKIFRVPTWKLEAWVEEGVTVPPPARQWRRRA